MVRQTRGEFKRCTAPGPMTVSDGGRVRMQRSGIVEYVYGSVFGIIRLGELRQFEHDLARARRIGKAERDRGLIGGRLGNPLQLLELFHAALHL